ncbi:MAG: hypothetical protein ABIV26_07365 [Candidatus Limnocylindrales bacterium]
MRDPGQIGQNDPLDSAKAAQFLATEHWSLLATRSMSWNEAFSRTGMFLSTLSAATVALALVGPATSFGGTFLVFALVILSITLFLGVATFVRLSQVNNEDLYWVAGMNRLRGAYVRLVPGIEDEFVTGHTVDTEGVSRSFAAMDVLNEFSPLHALVTTPAVVGIISASIGGTIAGLLAIGAGASMVVAIVAGLVVLAIGVALFVQYARRDMLRYVGRMMDLEAARGPHGGGEGEA